MKIGPLESKPVAPPAPAERKGQPSAVENKTEASTQVDLTSRASLLSGVSTDPTFDAGKVDRIAQAIRRKHPDVHICLGGGFVNTELRELAEPRLFDLVDFVTLDAGERPHRHRVRPRARDRLHEWPSPASRHR